VNVPGWRDTPVTLGFAITRARSLYLGVMDIKVSRTRKIALIKKTFTNFIKKQPEYQWTNT
jgi:hypothetical protein